MLTQDFHYKITKLQYVLDIKPGFKEVQGLQSTALSMDSSYEKLHPSPTGRDGFPAGTRTGGVGSVLGIFIFCLLKSKRNW